MYSSHLFTRSALLRAGLRHKEEFLFLLTQRLPFSALRLGPRWANLSSRLTALGSDCNCCIIALRGSIESRFFLASPEKPNPAC
jgi:hypothetical protein